MIRFDTLNKYTGIEKYSVGCKRLIPISQYSSDLFSCFGQFSPPGGANRHQNIILDLSATHNREFSDNATTLPGIMGERGNQNTGLCQAQPASGFSIIIPVLPFHPAGHLKQYNFQTEQAGLG